MTPERAALVAEIEKELRLVPTLNQRFKPDYPAMAMKMLERMDRLGEAVRAEIVGGIEYVVRERDALRVQVDRLLGGVSERRIILSPAQALALGPSLPPDSYVIDQLLPLGDDAAHPATPEGR